MTDATPSKSGCLVRLTDERWAHIIEEHCELAGLRREILEAVSDPQRVLEGNVGERFAVREVEPDKWLVVVYCESGADGFVITAFLTRRMRSFERRRQLWP